MHKQNQNPAFLNYPLASRKVKFMMLVMPILGRWGVS